MVGVCVVAGVAGVTLYLKSLANFFNVVYCLSMKLRKGVVGFGFCRTELKSVAAAWA